MRSLAVLWTMSTTSACMISKLPRHAVLKMACGTSTNAFTCSMRVRSPLMIAFVRLSRAVRAPFFATKQCGTLRYALSASIYSQSYIAYFPLRIQSRKMVLSCWAPRNGKSNPTIFRFNVQISCSLKTHFLYFGW